MTRAGDLDLVVGNNDGLLNYIENNGRSTVPVFVQRTGNANPFDAVGIYGIYVGSVSAPALADFDNDGTLRPCLSIDELRLHNFVARTGDLDLVVGERSGKLIYIENTGTSTEPEFAEFVAFLDFSPKSSYSYSYSYLYDDDYVDDDYVPTMPPSRQSNYSNLFAGIAVGHESIPALGDIDDDGTLIPRPSIDKLRPHVHRLSQATWTS